MSARAEGHDAAMKGVVVGDNPYPYDPPPARNNEHWQWMDGWADGAIQRIAKEKSNARKTSISK